METRANYVAVGAFVLVTLGALIFAALWFARVEFAQDYTRYVSYFTGSSGVGAEAVVRINGISLGRVNSVTLDPHDHRRVIVRYDVRSEVPLHEGAAASSGSAGLTGQSFLQIQDGGNEAGLLTKHSAEGDLIVPTHPSTIQRLEEVAPQIASQAAIISQRMAALLDDKNMQAIAQTLSNVRDASAVLSRRSNDLDHIIANSAVATQRLAETLDTLNKTTTELRTMLAHANQVPQHLDTMLVTLNDTTRKLGMLTGDLDQSLRETQPQLRQFSHTGLNQLTALSGEMRGLVSSLSHLSQQIDRDPNRVVFGDTRQGYTPR